MEIAEVKCNICGKEILVQKDYIREKMFCTIGCMDSYFGKARSNNRFVNKPYNIK